jgi:hypothetical protein
VVVSGACSAALRATLVVSVCGVAAFAAGWPAAAMAMRVRLAAVAMSAVIVRLMRTPGRVAGRVGRAGTGSNGSHRDGFRLPLCEGQALRGPSVDARSGALQEKGTLALVPRQARGTLEFCSRLVHAAELVEQVAPHTRKQVIGAHRRVGGDPIEAG